jgi:RNA polymerase sigma factor (TIGR02999 family)
MSSSPDITLMLNQLATGDATNRDVLWNTLSQELRTLAKSLLAREKPGHTLQPTALINEAYLRLLGSEASFTNRRYFFGAAAQAMRRILVDSARHKQSLKAGGQHEQRTLEEPAWTPKLPPAEVLAIHEALELLKQEDAISAEVVNLHFFAGFSLEEAAELLDLSRASAYRSWTYARAWLRDQLSPENSVTISSMT